MITILYFARLRDALGLTSEQVALPAGVSDIESLRAMLRGRGASWESELGDQKRVRAAVNQDMARGDTPVKDGDEIAFFPPVTGG